MTSAWKTYRASFCVRDYYEVELKARSSDEAETRASDLYERFGEARFNFDLSRGGTDDWEAEEIRAQSIDESTDNA